MARASGLPHRRRRAGARQPRKPVRLVPMSPSRSRRSTGRTSIRLLERIGDARVVLLGEATHGTSEFYRMRARITQELIARARTSASSPSRPIGPTPRASIATCGTAQRSRLGLAGLRAVSRPGCGGIARSRAFVDWLRDPQRRGHDAAQRVALLGPRPLQPVRLDCERCSQYLDAVDPATAQRRPRTLRLPHALAERSRRLRARRAHAGATAPASRTVVAMLRDLLQPSGSSTLGGTASTSSTPSQNAARWSPTPSATTAPCTTGRASRGTCATGTCSTRSSACSQFHGPSSKAVVWAHNSHVGDAARDRDGRARRAQRRTAVPSAIRRRGLHRRLRHGPRHGRGRLRLGWADGDQERAPVTPAQLRAPVPRLERRARSCCHSRAVARAELRDELTPPRLERAIGVIYRPETELAEPLLPRGPARPVRRVHLVR